MHPDLATMNPEERRRLLQSLLTNRPDGAADTLYPLSEGERAIWFYHELNAGNSSLNLGEALRVQGGLQIAHLRRALALLTQRHDVLRSRLALLNGQPFKRILPAGEIPLEALNLDGLGENERANRLGAFIDRRFDLANAPPVRLGLYQEPTGDTVLVFAMHHIIADFWSLVLLITDFFELYAAAKAERPPALAPVQASYEAFVTEQMRYLRSEDAAADGRFWADALAALPDLSRPDLLPGVEDADQGTIATFEIDTAALAATREFSRCLEVSTYTTLLSAFTLLQLRRHSVDAAVIGAPVTGRSHERYAGVVGYFDNPLPLVLRQTSGQTVGHFVRAVRDVVLDAIRHQAYPLQRIMEDLRPKRAANAGPLFNTVFTMLQAPSSTAGSLTNFGIGDRSATAVLAGITVGSVETRRKSAQVDLALTLATPGGRLVGSFEYDPARYRRKDIEWLGEAFGTALRSMVSDIDQPIDRVPVLAGAERLSLLRDHNRTEGPLPQFQSLHEPFHRQAMAAPGRVAVIAAGVEMTYGEVNQRANGVAAWLAQQGLAAQDHVAVLMPKGWQQIVAVIGVLKAGGAYLPVDPDLPAARQQQIIARAGARLVLVAGDTDTRLAHDIGPGLSALAIETAPELDDGPSLPADKTARAYTIFTSGSTGEPKGVMISHQGALNTLEDVNRRLDVGPDDRVLALSSLSFDLSVYDIFGVLGRGGAIILPHRDELHNPEAWLRLCEQHRITLWNTVPALFKLAIEAAETVTPSCALHSLRAVMLSGDWIPLDLPDRARALCGPHRFISMGGATEASVWSIWYEVDAVNPAWSSIPYGLPMTNQSIFVLDANFEPVLPGSIGDLYIGGVGVMLGYCGDEALTGQALMPGPLDGARIYRTGDLGRRSKEGWIEFLGRSDSQVKLRGFRIETQEIETTLRRLDGVDDCVVLLTGNGDDAQLVAFVVTSAPEAPDGTRLRALLADTLPAYMLPARFVQVGQIPLTANGKVDRQALAKADVVSDAGSAEPTRAHRSHEESIVARLASDILGHPVDLDRDLIASGGNSIDAIRLAASLRRAGYAITTRTLIEAPCLASVAEQMVAAGSDSADHRAPHSQVVLRLPAPVSDHKLEQARAHLFAQWAIEYGVAGGDRQHLFSITRGDDQPDCTVALSVAAHVASMQQFRRMTAQLIGATSIPKGIGLGFAEQTIGQRAQSAEPASTSLVGAVQADYLGAQITVPLPETGWWRRQFGLVELLARATLANVEKGAAVDVLASTQVLDEAPRGTSDDGVRRWRLKWMDAAAERLPEQGILRMAAPDGRSAVSVHMVQCDGLADVAAAAGVQVMAWRDAAVAGSDAGVRVVVEVAQDRLTLTFDARQQAGEGLKLDALLLTLSRLLRAPDEPPRADWIDLPPAANPGLVPGADEWPLAPLQHTMLVHSLVSDDPGLYCQHLYWRAEGSLDDERLSGAMADVIAQIPALRVAFDPWRGGAPIQRVQPATSPEYVCIETDAEGWTTVFDRLVEADRARGFDLGIAPLLHFYRLKLSDRESILVLCHHHILFDGWSVPLLLQALLRAYAGMGSIPARLADYPSFLAHLHERPVDQAAAYWRELLAGADLPTPLPAGARAATEHRQQQQEVLWDADFIERLEGAARQIGVTAGAMVIAGWSLLLARHGGCEDVVFGVTGAGRPEALDGVDEIVGLFINTVPVRASMSGDQTLATLASSLHRQFTHSREYEQTTLHDIADALGAERRGFDPFQTVLVFENYPDTGLMRAPDLDLVFHQPGFTERTATPLLIYVFPGKTWTVRMVYNAALFDAEVIAAILGQLRLALDQLVERPLHTVRQTCLATNEDALFFDSVNAHSINGDPPSGTVCDLLALRARTVPDGRAVVSGDEVLTWLELDNRSSDLARALRQRQVAPGDVIALDCGHSVNTIIAMHAVLKAGACFLPLDENAPIDRHIEVVEAAGARIILSDRSGSTLSGLADVVDLTAPLDHVTNDPLPALQDVSPAYVIFTSGSTGRPKGVVISHASLMNYVCAVPQIYGWGPEDRLLQFFSLGFDGSLEVIFGSVAAGATLVLRPMRAEWSLDAFNSVIEREAISSISVTTAFWQVWLEALDARAEQLPDTLRSVLIGGERNALRAAAAWRRCGERRGVRLFNTYGPTEATIVATVSEILYKNIDVEAGHDFPIGSPVPGATVHVADRYGLTAPLYAPGELYLGGAGLAIGYLGDPAGTASAFGQWEGLAQERLYKTGDKVRFRPDRMLEFRGRMDEQIKIRGYRVEPAEIEAAIASIAGIRACAVTTIGTPASTRLIAHLVMDASGTDTMPDLSDPTGGDVGTLKAQLRRRLPDYMIPDRFYLLGALPLTSNGKLDRARLSCDNEISDQASAADPPVGETEQVIAAIWADLLGAASVSRHDDFFELGGHSLLAMQMVTRLSETFGVQPSAADMFTTPTVASLSSRILDLMLADYDEQDIAAASEQMLGVPGNTDPAGGEPDD